MWCAFEWLPSQFPHVIETPGIAGIVGYLLHHICTLTNGLSPQAHDKYLIELVAIGLIEPPTPAL